MASLHRESTEMQGAGNAVHLKVETKGGTLACVGDGLPRVLPHLHCWHPKQYSYT